MSNEAFEKWFDEFEDVERYGFECHHFLTRRGWHACEAYNQQRIQELEAHINVLREALEEIDSVLVIRGSDSYIQKLIQNILASTPQQSLQKVIDATIEKCAKEVESLHDGMCIAEIIRALKGRYD